MRIFGLMVTLLILFCSQSLWAESWESYYIDAVAEKKQFMQSEFSSIAVVLAEWVSVSGSEQKGAVVQKHGERNLHLVDQCPSSEQEGVCVLEFQIHHSNLTITEPKGSLQKTFVGKIPDVWMWNEPFLLQFSPYKVRIGRNTAANTYRFMIYEQSFDPMSDPRTQVEFYPYNEKYKVDVTLMEDPLYINDEDAKRYYVSFLLEGKEYTLRFGDFSRETGAAAFFITDEISLRDTYIGGRMMFFEFKPGMNVGDKDAIDFNFLQYPPCYESTAFGCDPTTDHLDRPIEAGESTIRSHLSHR